MQKRQNGRPGVHAALAERAAGDPTFTVGTNDNGDSVLLVFDASVFGMTLSPQQAMDLAAALSWFAVIAAEETDEEIAWPHPSALMVPRQ